MHPNTANSYSNLGGIYAREEEYKVAITYLFKVFKIMIFRLGKATQIH